MSHGRVLAEQKMVYGCKHELKKKDDIIHSRLACKGGSEEKTAGRGYKGMLVCFGWLAACVIFHARGSMHATDTHKSLENMNMGSV